MSIRKIEPMSDYILVEVVEEKQESLIAPVNDEPDLFMFRVLSVGPGKVGMGGRWVKPDCLPGDVLLLSDRGSWVEIEPPKVAMGKGFKKSGGKLLISWDSVVGKVTEIVDDESHAS